MMDFRHCKNIIFLTGAGISQESGIKTFRDQNGLWENHSIQDVACPEAYRRNPALVHRFYNLRRLQLKEVEPNPAHLAIGKLSRLNEKTVTVITQNVDDLHERGGTKKVLHMHGELRRVRHAQTGESKHFEDEVAERDFVTWRPDIVWFGEQVKHGLEISSLVERADLFVAVGTSSQVYPAAGLVQIARGRGVPTVELNLERTPLSSLYTHSLQGKASLLVPEFIKKSLGVDL